MKDEIAILYEDEDILAIYKPAGVLVHGDGKETGQQATVAEWLLQVYPEVAGVGEAPILTNTGTTINRAGIVHRLDRDTSGVMLLARTQGKEGFVIGNNFIVSNLSFKGSPSSV